MKNKPIRIHLSRETQRIIAEVLFCSMEGLDYHEDDIREIMDMAGKVISKKNGTKSAGGFASWKKSEGI